MKLLKKIYKKLKRPDKWIEINIHNLYSRKKKVKKNKKKEEEE